MYLNRSMFSVKFSLLYVYIMLILVIFPQESKVMNAKNGFTLGWGTFIRWIADLRLLNGRYTTDIFLTTF